MARWSRMELRAARGVASAGTGLFLLLAGAPSHAADVVEYYHLDAIGNVRAVTNAAGQVVERHDYLPFGEECTTGSCASNPGVNAGQPRKFTGKERDAETGLDYFGARYLSAKIGRFTTTDPKFNIQASLTDPQRWNRYAYAKNNPLRYVDPDGKETTVISVITPIVGVPGGDVGLGFVFHSALRIDNNGSPILYDPSGGYGRSDGRGMQYDEDADLGKYIKAKTAVGEVVETRTFKTTPEQEAKILEQANVRGDAGRPVGCASNVSAAVQGVGPFQPVTPTSSPARLRRQVNSLPGGTTAVHEGAERPDAGAQRTTPAKDREGR